MKQETYSEYMQNKFGTFQGDWDAFARELAETLSQTLALQNSLMFSPNDAKKIKSACAELMNAIDEMTS
jgi:hypothetical protein